MEIDTLIEALAEYSADPLGYVYFAYPWGEGELARYPGPQMWQQIVLKAVGDGVLGVQEAIALASAQGEEADTLPIRVSRTSGHGIGKSALVAWLIDWGQSTCPDTKGVVTANTENQLKTKTWAELAKWHRLSVSSILFRMTATARFSVDPEHEREWRIDMVPWSEKNTEAFAGLHNYGKRILLIFDEASAIPDIIWETAEGALTDKNTEIIWACFGNPTRNTGRFRHCFEGGEFAHRWDHAAISSLDADITNKKQLEDWISDYGIDHDFVRVRVLGKFPRVDATSFISLEDALTASKRQPDPEWNAPCVIGVDVARFGDDKTVIYPRAGLDAKSRRVEVYQGLNTMQVATKAFSAYMQHQAIAIFVDVSGVGAGVYDRLLQMGAPAYPVDFGSGADNIDPEDPMTRYANKRAEIWGSMRSFLKLGCIPNEIDGAELSLPNELAGPTYTFVRETCIQLESKKDMKRRKVPSPDVADALACTFAYPALAPEEEEELDAIGETHYTDEYEYQ